VLRLSLDDAHQQRPGQSLKSTEGASSQPPESRIYDNITLGQARIMTGDVGVEPWQRASKSSIISHNKFGQDLRLMTGSVGAEASREFMANFWK
jgi:hypothetical protein